LDREVTRPRNMLLRALPCHDFDQLYPSLELIALKPRCVLQHARIPIEHFYFIEDGLVSVVTKTDEAKSVGVWLVGREGVVGFPLLVGRKAPLNRYVVQVAGSALRVRAEVFGRALNEISSLRRLLFRQLMSVLLQTSQLSSCNLCHSLTQRLARWILIARDRSDRDELPITQHALARVLGVRRASISECLHRLQQRGLLGNTRGLISILDGPGLEALSCRCYHIIRNEQEGVLACLMDTTSSPPADCRKRATVAATRAKTNAKQALGEV